MVRRLLVVLLLAASVAAPAAQADGSRLAAAFVRTAQAPSYRFALDGTIAVTRQTVPLRATGAFDKATGSAQIALDLSKLPGLSPSGGGRLEILVDGRTLTLYIRFPLLKKLLKTSKPWLKLDLRRFAGGRGFDLGSLLQTNPSDQLQLACALTGAPRALGTVDVRGVATTRFRVLLDYSQAARCAPAGLRAQLRKLEKQLPGAAAVPLDVYVGGDGYVHRVGLSYALRAQGQAVRTQLTFDLYDFGTPIDVSPPPAAQVTDVTKLIGKLTLGGS